jgi:hypothetical protein
MGLASRGESVGDLKGTIPFSSSRSKENDPDFVSGWLIAACGLAIAPEIER